MESYVDVNRASWDARARAHATSPDYAVAHFIEDPSYLSEVVRFDLPRLGDVSGVRGVHLQCHIGTDTISLARLGAEMMGLDFSVASLAQARELAGMTGAEVEFVQSEVYKAVTALGPDRFDLVFTGVGALCWLPSVARWARVVSELLVTGGRLFLREGHPMLWALDEARPDGLLVVDHPYFEREEPVIDEYDGTYVKTDVKFDHNLTHTWNHGIGELVTALLQAGFEITGLEEHDSVPWEALPGQMEHVQSGEWRLIDRPWRLAHTFTLQAIKRG